MRHIETLLVAISVRSLPYRVSSLSDAGITIKQLRVLSSLSGADERTLTELADEFEVSLPTMSGIVDKLVRRELVERVVDEEDQRSRRLGLTAFGHSVFGEIVAPDPRLGEEVVAGLEIAELEALEVGLAAISRELRKLGD